MCSWKDPDHRWKHMRRGWFLFAIPMFLLFLAIGSLVVMFLWNALLPAIFGLKEIGFLQAVGVLILAKILFGGFGRRPSAFVSRRRHWERWKEWHESEHSEKEGA